MTRSTFWFAAAKTAGYGLTIVLPLLLVRVLTQFEFGLYKQAFQVTQTAARLLPFGMGLSAFYFFPRYPDRQEQTASNIMLFHLSVGMAGFLAVALYPRVLNLALGETQLVRYAPLIGLVILTWIFSSFLETVAAALADVTRSTLFIVAAQLTKTLFMVAAALVSASVEALLWAALAQGVLQSAILIRYVQFRFPGFWRHADWPAFRAQFAYIAPLSLANLLFIFRSDLPSYFVAHHFTPAEFAIFAVGASQLPLISILQESVGAVMLPRVNELHHRGEFRELTRLLVRATRKIAAVYWPFFVFFALLAEEFIVAFYTRQYAAGAPIFLVNLLIIPLGVVPLDPIFRAYPELRFFLLNVRVVLIALLVLGLYFGIAHLGMMGAIGAVVAVTIAERLIHIGKVFRVLRPKRQDLAQAMDILKLGVAAGLAAVPTAAVRFASGGLKPFWTLALCAPVFAVSYGAAVYGLRILAPEEKAALWAALRKYFILPG